MTVFGSASLLASFPELEDQGLLDTTYDGDLLLDPMSKEIAAYLSEAIGRDSLFHSQKGYHADILHPSIVECLPPGWDARLVPLRGLKNVFALDPYDLAATKLVVAREKDIALVRVLVELGKISLDNLRRRLNTMPLGEKELFRAGRNFAEVAGEIGSPTKDQPAIGPVPPDAPLNSAP